MAKATAVDPVGADAHERGGDNVLGGCPHGRTDEGPFQEEDHHDGREDGHDKAREPGEGDADPRNRTTKDV